MIFKSLVLGFLLFGFASSKKDCSDCIKVVECPQALALVKKKYDVASKHRIFENAFCGDDIINYKICCSDFSKIENHPNRNLLPENCEEIQGNKIYGGSQAAIFEFPWLVLLGSRIDHKLIYQCGGTLINSRYVLTAAHCTSRSNITDVKLGEYAIRKEINCITIEGKLQECAPEPQIIPVTHTIVHPNFIEQPVIVNDISLLRLKRVADVSSRSVMPICLPAYQELIESDLSNEPAVIAGWGATENNAASNVQLKATVPILSYDACEDAYKSVLPHFGLRLKNSLCAGDMGVNPCEGDSGGPLMMEGLYNETDVFVQYGIISYGLYCDQGKPSFYTDVRKFMPWILDTIKP